MSIFMYADDLVLLSPSVCHLQRMINVVAGDLDMAIKTDESYCISFGKRHSNDKISLTLNGTDLVWKRELKYLGIVFFASKKLSIDLAIVNLPSINHSVPFIAKFANPMKILFLHLLTLTVYQHCTTVWKRLI